MSSKERWLSDQQVQTLNERHGWFKHGDAQSDVSRAFANDAIEAHERLRRSAPDLLMRLTGLIAAAEYLQARVVETRGANCMDNLDVAIDEARAAIAKATGGAQ